MKQVEMIANDQLAQAARSRSQGPDAQMLNPVQAIASDRAKAYFTGTGA